MPAALSSGPRIARALSSGGSGLARGPNRQRQAQSVADQAAMDWAAICNMPQMVGYWDPAASSKTLAEDDGMAAAGAPIGFIPNLAYPSPPGTELATASWAASSGNTTASTANGVTTYFYNGSAGDAVVIFGSGITTVPGSTYEVSLNILKIGSIAVSFFVANSSWATTIALRYLTVPGVLTFRFVATDTTTRVASLYHQTASGQEAQIRDVSFKLVSVKDASQVTTANKPILRQTPLTKKYWFDADSTDALNITIPQQLNNCAIFRVTAEGVTVASGQTVATTYNLITPYAYNGPVAIFNEALGALTDAEIARITRFMQASVPMLGAEKMPNGTFNSNTTGWSPINNGTLSAVSGEMQIDCPAGPNAYPGATTGLSLSSSTAQLSWSVTSRRGTNAAGPQLYIQGLYNKSLPYSQTNATTKGAGTSSSANPTMQCLVSSATAGAGTVYFDDVSVKEIL